MNRVIIYSYASNTLRESRPGPVGAVKEAVIRAFDALAEWQGRIMERRRLMELDERLLRDAGLTRAEAIAEHAKPFWRP